MRRVMICRIGGTWWYAWVCPPGDGWSWPSKRISRVVTVESAREDYAVTLTARRCEEPRKP